MTEQNLADPQDSFPNALVFALAVGSAVFVSAWAGVVLSRETGFIAVIWFSNAILACALIDQPLKRWPLMLAGAFAGFMAANEITGTAHLTSIGLTVCNILEAVLFAVLFRRLGDRVDLSRTRTLVQVIAIAVGPPTMLAALGGAGVLWATEGVPFFDVLRLWYPADILGLLIIVPFVYALRGAALKETPVWQNVPKALLILGFVLISTILVFSQDALPLLFVIFFPLALASLHLGLAGAAVCVVAVGAIALAATLHGMGPLVLLDGPMQESVLILQAFAATATLTVLPISTVLADHRRMAKELEAAKERAEASDAAHVEAADLLHVTLENMDQGLFMVDRDGLLRVHNARALDLLKLPKKLFETPPHASEILAFQEQRGDFESLTEEERKKIFPSSVRDALTTYERTAPGGRRLEIRSLPIGDGGIVRTYTDVTEQRAAERKIADREALFRLLAEHATDMISRIGLDGTRRYDSPAATRILGYTPEELKTLGIRNRVHHEDLAAYDRLNDPNALKRDGTSSATYRFRRKDGAWVWIEKRARVLVDPETGDARELIAVSRDVTDQQEQAELLRQASQAAERSAAEADAANRAKSDFLARMSHELRTPLNAIIGFGQMLRMNGEGNLSQEELDYCDYVIRGGDHLLNLVNELLDLAGIESGKMKLSIETVSPLDVIGQAVATMKPIAEESGVAITVGDLSLDGLVLADAQRLRQILLNLLSNAVKYNEAGGKVTVHCRRSERKIRISVDDDGLGIPAEHQEKIFEPFNRLGAEYTAVEGFGIGLSLSKKLVEAMNGTIGFSSVASEGSSFWVELPASTEQILGTTSQTFGHQLKQSGLQGCKVLYIEDNPANLRLMESIVGTMPQTELLTAPSGSLGLDLAQSARPDVVLLDLHLPGMDGFEILKRLKGDRKTWDIPVIALTASAMPKDVERGLEAGFYRYLTKPIDVNALVAGLEDAASESRGRSRPDARHG